MDFRQFGIDDRLVSGAPSLKNQALFHEKMLVHAVQNHENVCARISLKSGRDAVFLLPALQWVAEGGESRRILCVSPDSASALACARSASALGAGIGLGCCTVHEPVGGSDLELEGSPAAAFVAGTPASLLAAQASGCFSLPDFRFLLVDSGEKVAELPEEILHHFQAALLPASERKTIVVCAKITVKAKNLAWDLSENPVEIHIEEEAAKAHSVAQETWHIASERKLCFLLGLLARLKPERTCVFCNLKSGAEELALRLHYDGVETESVLADLGLDRKRAILEDIEAEPGSVLVLTDEGALGLPVGHFPLVVNYDIPLDPELYVRRLEMLSREDAAARAVNLACERYIVGLPAVERHIDARLDAAQVPEDLLRAEDKSAEFAYEQPRPETSRGAKKPMAGRLVPLAQGRPATAPGSATAASGPKVPSLPGRASQGEGQKVDPIRSVGTAPSGDSRQGARRDGAGRRDDHGRHDSRGQVDRSPDIMRSIAEATGGSLGVEGYRRAAEETEKPERKAAASALGKKPSKASKPSKQGRGGKAPAKAERQQTKAVHKADSRPAGTQKAGHKGPGTAVKTPPEGQRRQHPNVRIEYGSESGNPYELSMEERMAKYRQKYEGKTPSASAKPDPRSSGRKKGSQPSGASAKGRPTPSPKPTVPRPIPAKSAPASEEKPKRGLLGRLFGGKRS
jgi:superfamily II DNA/RNA helicase